jgi:hypothetical protein
VPIYIDITTLYDAANYPADGDAQVRSAITAWGDAQLPGKDAVANAIITAAMSVDGMLDVTSIDMDDVDPPVGSATVAIGSRERATYDSGDIDITSGAGTP